MSTARIVRLGVGVEGFRIEGSVFSSKCPMYGFSLYTIYLIANP